MKYVVSMSSTTSKTDDDDGVVDDHIDGNLKGIINDKSHSQVIINNNFVIIFLLKLIKILKERFLLKF